MVQSAPCRAAVATHVAQHPHCEQMNDGLKVKNFVIVLITMSSQYCIMNKVLLNKIDLRAILN